MKLPRAEDINYWKTSTSSPDNWLEKAAKLIEGLGGNVVMHAFGKDPASGRQAYMIMFEIKGDQFKIIWPVLPTDYRNSELATKRQAATLLFHDVKNKCLNALIKGHKRAFFEYILLPDGRTAGDLSGDEIINNLPKLMKNITAELLE